MSQDTRVKDLNWMVICEEVWWNDIGYHHAPQIGAKVPNNGLFPGVPCHALEHLCMVERRSESPNAHKREDFGTSITPVPTLLQTSVGGSRFVYGTFHMYWKRREASDCETTSSSFHIEIMSKAGQQEFLYKETYLC